MQANFKKGIQDDDASNGLMQFRYRDSLLSGRRDIRDHFRSANGRFQCSFHSIEDDILYIVCGRVPEVSDVDRVSKIIRNIQALPDLSPRSLIWDMKLDRPISATDKANILYLVRQIDQGNCPAALIAPQSFKSNFLKTELISAMDDRQTHIASNLAEALDFIKDAQHLQSNPHPKEPLPMNGAQLEKLSKQQLLSRLQEEREYYQQRNAALMDSMEAISWDGKQSQATIMPSRDDAYYPLFRTLSFLQDKAGTVVEELTDLTNNLEMRIAEGIIEKVERQSNLRAVLDNLRSAIFLIDGKYRLMEFNDVFVKEVCSRHHFEPEPGEPFLDMIVDLQERDQWKERLDKTLEGKQGIYVDQSMAGDDTHVYETKTCPIIESGKVKGVIVFISDITHIQKSELKLIEKNRDLDRINKELDNFVYRISHDLRAPLTSIMGLINLIKLEHDQEKLTNYIDLQEKSVKKLDHFIKDIINLSRNTRIAVSVEQIDYEELLNGIFSRFSQEAAGVDIEKRLIIDGQLPFYSDRQRLEVILTNLVANSIKFYNSHQSNPYVHVYVTSGPEEAIIEVRDNGIGIAAEYLNKIYSMFFRAAKDNPGSGLGLYIVKEIVNKIKGQVSVRSKLREGTTFTLRIPNLVKRYEAAANMY